MFGRLTADSARIVKRAQLEARGLGQDFLGTEHLLLALFGGGHAAARALQRLGVSRSALLEEYRGTGLCGPRVGTAPSRDALASVGIDLDEVRRRVDGAFGSGALEKTCSWQRAAALRCTDRTKRVLELAIRDAGDQEAGPEHILLGLISGPGLAADLLARRGVSPGAVRAALAREFPQPA